MQKTLQLITLLTLPQPEQKMIPNRKTYYILSNKIPLVAHFRLNLAKVLFLTLTYFSISNLVLILCFRRTISGNMFVLLQSHRYNLAISNK